MIYISDEELVTRAMGALFVAQRRAWEIPDQPSSQLSGIEKYEGKEYVVLRNVRGVLAVYRLRNDGLLKRLRRWPTELVAFGRGKAS